MSNIKTLIDIQSVVSLLPGTWVKRRNLRVKLITASNKEVNSLIDTLRKTIRSKKACGTKQHELSPLFSKITNLELKLIEAK